jgi:flagellar capping protein FliD
VGLHGLGLTLKSVGTSTVTVSPPAADPEALTTQLKAFVSAYNDAVDLVRGKLTEKRVADPQSDADAGLGVSVASSGAANSPDTLAGKLTFDEDAFDEAWAADPLAVRAKLGAPEATPISSPPSTGIPTLTNGTKIIVPETPDEVVATRPALARRHHGRGHASGLTRAAQAA